jgi:hypothetical protein
MRSLSPCGHDRQCGIIPKVAACINLSACASQSAPTGVSEGSDSRRDGNTEVR